MPKSPTRLLLAVGLSVLFGCGTDPRFHDTRQLEQPPNLKTEASNEHAGQSFDPLVTLEAVQNGLGDKVQLEQLARGSVLTIDAPFAQSWFIVQISLQSLGLVITDLDRQSGEYFIDFDPDERFEDKLGRKSGLFSRLAALFSSDQYRLRSYRLSLHDAARFTEITASYTPDALLADAAEQDKDQAPYPDEPADGPDRLLALLHRVISQGLPKSAQDKAQTPRGRGRKQSTLP